MLNALLDNWMTVAIALVALAVAWWVLTGLLKLTKRAFTMGCAMLIVMVLLVGGTYFLSQ